MELEKIEVINDSTKQHMCCICLNYEQFVSDCDTLTQSRYDGFGINPKERFYAKVDRVLNEIMNGERTLPCRACIRLESRHSICNTRIDYTFELMGKKFLKENVRGNEIAIETLKACLDSDADCIMQYIGMNE